jgi:hypothetical protein
LFPGFLRAPDRDGVDVRHVHFQGEPMSEITIAPARHPRLRRIAVTGTLLIAATVAVVGLGQAGLIAPASAASIKLSAATRPVVSERLTKADESALTAVVTDKQEAHAAAMAAAQAAAARAAADAAAAAQAAARAASAARVAASTTTLNVWTAGWQSEINACRGGVDITAHYGTPTVAQHWGCGGSSFPTAAGTIIHFTGLDAGTYRVIGVVAVLDAYTAKTNQLPHGYDMLFQTCRNDDSHTTEFIALQKVG